MSQDVSNRMLEMRDYLVSVFREIEMNFGFPAQVLAQQVYLVLSSEEAKPFVEDMEGSVFTGNHPKENLDAKPAQPNRRPSGGDRSDVPATGD